MTETCKLLFGFLNANVMQLSFSMNLSPFRFLKAVHIIDRVHAIQRLCVLVLSRLCLVWSAATYTTVRTQQNVAKCLIISKTLELLKLFFPTLDFNVQSTEG